jgi:hypothetical protein
MYRLYRSGNGQVQQVPVNNPTEDEGIEEQFPNPLEAKGNQKDVAPFVLQQERQFDLIKQNETQQAKFQTKKLQNSNYQVINFQIRPTDSVTSQAFYRNEYNLTTAVGTALDDGVMFGTSTKDVTKAKYYNIVYANVRLAQAVGSTAGEFLEAPSFVEFYLMQKLNTGDFGGKISRQIQAVSDRSNLNTLSVGGNEFGVQSFGVDIYNENAYYAQSKDLKGMRCIGVALKKIQINLDTAIDISEIRLDCEIGYDLKTEGNNY